MNSFLIAGSSALVTTVLIFLMAYTVHYTNVNRYLKKLIEMAAMLPMLLPTITYGFAVIFIVPFVEEWPYELHFTMKNVANVLKDTELSNVYVNSLYVAFFTAMFGTLLTYGSALVTARSHVPEKLKK